MLTPKEKRQYDALAAKLNGPKITISGNAITVGRDKLRLPGGRPTHSSQGDVF